jgi:hypothetical protein
MVVLKVRFGAPLTGLNSPAILALLTVPRRRPSVFLRFMSMLFHTILATLLLVSHVVFSSTVSIFPCALWLCGPICNHIFVFFEFLINYKLFPIFQTVICFLWIPYQLQIICYFSDHPVRALPYALSWFCSGSAWAPCHWFLLLSRVGVAFIGRRLS